MAPGSGILVAIPIVAMVVAPPMARAQLDLPPPPPPPMGQSPQETPPLPRSETEGPSSAQRRAAPAVQPPPRHAHAHHRSDVPVDLAPAPPEASTVRSVAVMLNPLGLPWGRLSADVDAMPWGPHHTLVLSANGLIASADRGGAGSLLSNGFGFASRASSGLGFEVGYHYGLSNERSIRGPFFGPSLLAGSTTQATVGDPSRAQAYFGLAFDAGIAEVLANGLTAGGGLGLGYVRMAGTAAVFPRFLAQVGWSF